MRLLLQQQQPGYIAWGLVRGEGGGLALGRQLRKERSKKTHRSSRCCSGHPPTLRAQGGAAQLLREGEEPTTGDGGNQRNQRPDYVPQGY